MTTIKNARAASDMIQGSNASPADMLARILDLETVAAGALADLRKAEADAIAAAATAAAAPAVDVQTLAAEVQQLRAQLAASTQTSA